jgi:polyhydroxyalkanoate synthesis repressor PhaR
LAPHAAVGRAADKALTAEVVQSTIPYIALQRHPKEPTMADQAPGGGDKTPVINIKKYANRRLYNTATSSYVTLEDLATMVRQNVDFIVTDAKTNEDITRSVLTQIIVEQESKGQSLLPIKFLRQVIAFYGDSLGGVLPRYLEHSMESFAQNETHMRRIMQDAFKGLFPMQRMEEMGKQNLALFENAMKMFNPFANQSRSGETAGGVTPPSAKSASGGDNLESLKSQLDALQARLERMAKDRG